MIRSLASIYEEGGCYFWKNIEILRDQKTGRSSGLNKYEGALFYLTDRICIMEYETLEKHSITLPQLPQQTGCPRRHSDRRADAARPETGGVETGPGISRAGHKCSRGIETYRLV